MGRKPSSPVARRSVPFEAIAIGKEGGGRTSAAMRWVIVALLLVLTWLQYRVWVGEGSLAEVHSLKQEIIRQSAELDQLRARNRALLAEVQNLKEGVEALEERARAELGMVKEGEVFYQVIEPSNPPPKP